MTSNNQTKTKSQGWRSRLAVHPAAELFPLMAKDELRALADDIAKNGLREKAITYHDKDGKPVLLDGRNRLDALELLGPVNYSNVVGIKVADPVAYVISKNIHRRHLTSDQKRELVGKLLKLDPAKSDRQIAATAKVSDKTVAAERRKKEARAEIPHVAKRTDSRGRRQPASKPTSKSKQLVEVTLGQQGEISAEQRKAEMAALDTEDAKFEEAGKDIASAKQLAEFKVACDIRLPNMNPQHRREALAYCTMKAGAATESPPPAMETVH